MKMLETVVALLQILVAKLPISGLCDQTFRPRQQQPLLEPPQYADGFWRGPTVDQFWYKYRPSVNGVESTDSPVWKWLLKKQVDENYDSTRPPFWSAEYGYQPTQVLVDFFVENIGNFQALAMEYSIDIYFVERWTDPRLRHNRSSVIQFADDQLVKSVWKPDVYLANSKRANYNRVTVPNQIYQIWPNGQIRFSVRIAAVVSCYMNLRAFPMDRQMCFLKLLTYGNNASLVRLSWAKDKAPIEMNPNIAKADLFYEKLKNCSCIARYSVGNYSCLQAEFFFRRSIGQNVLQVYVPTFCIVCISWISFWVEPTSVPGRVGLAVTTLLTLATQAAGVAFNLPPVGYAKAMDIWFSVCLLFLFSTLIEFTMVNIYTRRWQSYINRNNNRPKMALTVSVSEDGVNNGSSGRACSFVSLGELYRQRAKKIDLFSRYLFPTCFGVFLLFYWTIFLNYDYFLGAKYSSHYGSRC